MSYIGTVSRPAVNNIIPDNSITAAKIVDGAIVAADLAENSVGTSELDIANITGVLPVGVTGGSGLTSPLQKAGGTMTGTIAGFTSTGIDDNATSTAMTIDNSSIVTMPYQPAFDVSRGSEGSANLTGIISHPVTYIDRGNDHNGTRFTAPVTGVYHFYTSHIKNAPAVTVNRRRFLVNGAAALNGRHQRLDETATGYNGAGTFSMLISLSVGDYIEVDQWAGASHGSWEYDYFGGHLVG